MPAEISLADGRPQPTERPERQQVMHLANRPAVRKAELLCPSRQWLRPPREWRFVVRHDAESGPSEAVRAGGDFFSVDGFQESGEELDPVVCRPLDTGGRI